MQTSVVHTTKPSGSTERRDEAVFRRVMTIPIPIKVTTQSTAPAGVNVSEIPTIYPLSIPKPREYLDYSGNYKGVLSAAICLQSKIDVLSSAVESGRINGFRYYNASTGTMKNCGSTGKRKANQPKKIAKTRRKRSDFDHQISIWPQEKCHVKLFQTGKMVIPACGSPETARKAFQLIADICKVSLVKISCTNRNIRITFAEISTSDMLVLLDKKDSCYAPTLGKRNRLKSFMWWNRNYSNDCVCKCQPESCLFGKNKNDEFEGKCRRSTIMWGKKSVTIFGTNDENQRLVIVKSLRALIAELRNKENSIYNYPTPSP